MKYGQNNHSSRKWLISKGPVKLQQTCSKPYSKLTHISQRRKGRGRKGKKAPEENSKGGSPGTLLPYSPAECAKCIQDANAVSPSSLSQFAFSSCHRFSTNVSYEERCSCSISPAWEQSQTVHKAKVFQGLVLTTTVLHCKQNCLCHKAARLNSLMFTKCLKTVEQKPIGSKQQKELDYQPQKQATCTHSDHKNSVVSQTHIY